jgi:hypothetical protein
LVLGKRRTVDATSNDDFVCEKEYVEEREEDGGNLGSEAILIELAWMSDPKSAPTLTYKRKYPMAVASVNTR